MRFSNAISTPPIWKRRVSSRDRMQARPHADVIAVDANDTSPIRNLPASKIQTSSETYSIYWKPQTVSRRLFEPDQQHPEELYNKDPLNALSTQLAEWPTIEQGTAHSPAEVATDFQLSTASTIGWVLLISSRTSPLGE